MGLPEGELRELCIAALLYDIEKVYLQNMKVRNYEV